jgi:hydrophobe/amphiphile efflux-3 (HAE3) family protein
LLARLADAALLRPGVTLSITVALTLAGAALALTLRPSVAANTLVSSSSRAYRATQAADRTFGAAPVVVLVREPLRRLLSGQDLRTITGLEACIGGHTLTGAGGGGASMPLAGGRPYGGPGSPCGYLMRTRPVRFVYGPGTFVNQAVLALRAQLDATRATDRRFVEHVARVAYRLAIARGLSVTLARAAALAAAAVQAQRVTTSLARLANQAGLRGTPSIADPRFTAALVFGPGAAVRPRPSLAYLFPGRNAALIQARLRAGLGPAQTLRAIAAIRAAAALPRFRLSTPHAYTITGEPVVLSELSGRVTGSVGVLLAAAVLAMALALALLFGGPLALLPLGIALATAALTFGAFTIVGADLTLASLAALPILIGLAVDYAVQFQSRTRESFDGEPRAAVMFAATRGAPPIAVAALATSAGFLVLWLSPVPMMHGFGLLIVAAIAIALLMTLTVCPAVLALAASGFGAFGASVRGARQILRDARRSAGERLGRPLSAPAAVGRRRRPVSSRRRGAPAGAGASVAAFAADAAGRLTRHPRTVLAIAGVIALGGWAATTTLSVRTDITQLIGRDTPALRDLARLERASGVSGEVDVVVSAGDVALPRMLAWMSSYERRVLSHFGYRHAGGCTRASLCPAASLPDLFVNRRGQLDADAHSAGSIEQLLSTIPRYFTGAVISADRHLALLAFGVRLIPLSSEERLVEYMRRRLHPPPGVRAELAGLPVLAADSGAALSSQRSRLLVPLAGLMAVALVLLAAWRDPRRALVPLVPIVLASGWSALVLVVVGIPLDPMSATLGALVIAISTEFSVLLSERYRQERVAGASPELALGAAYRRTGAAAVTSGVTVIAGFAVLLLSDITMLRDFGLVTVIDLAASLVGVVLVLPAALAIAERGGAVREPTPGRTGRRIATGVAVDTREPDQAV